MFFCCRRRASYDAYGPFFGLYREGTLLRIGIFERKGNKEGLIPNWMKNKNSNRVEKEGSQFLIKWRDLFWSLRSWQLNTCTVTVKIPPKPSERRKRALCRNTGPPKNRRFLWERRSSGEKELSHRCGSDWYEACDDEDRTAPIEIWGVPAGTVPEQEWNYVTCIKIRLSRNHRRKPIFRLWI